MAIYVCMYMYVCMYVYVCVCMYMYVCKLCMCMYVCICMYVNYVCKHAWWQVFSGPVLMIGIWTKPRRNEMVFFKMFSLPE